MSLGGYGRKPGGGGAGFGRHAVQSLYPRDLAADRAGDYRWRTDGLYPIDRRFRRYFFTAGAGTATLPVKIYTMAKIAVTPEVNAVSTLLMLLTLSLIVVATKIAPGVLRRD